jgi:DNA-binding transcriptional ArsR family regulator
MLAVPNPPEVKKRRPSPAQARRAAERAKALGDATRLTLATLILAAGEISVSDLAELADCEESLVSHHLATLRKAGLVETERWKQRIFYKPLPRLAELLPELLAEPGSSLKVGPVHPSRP